MSAPGKRTGRAGGRAARVAARAAGPTEDEKAVRPGLAGGRYQPLTDSECRTVYDTALTLWNGGEPTARMSGRSARRLTGNVLRRIMSELRMVSMI